MAGVPVVEPDLRQSVVVGRRISLGRDRVRDRLLTDVLLFGELSARTGVSPRSLRYYEGQGLLVSSRAAGGHRHYQDAHVRRVAIIQAFLSAGLSSRTIREIAPCMDEPGRRAAQPAMVAMVRERARLSESIDSLVTARAALDDLIGVNHHYRQELDPAGR